MDRDIFIRHIKINKICNVLDFKIPLSPSERKHLIITGKNGSGKTTFLLELNKFLEQVFNGEYKKWSRRINHLDDLEKDKAYADATNDYNERERVDQLIIRTKQWFEQFGSLDVDFVGDEQISDEALQGNFLIAFFEAERATKANLQIPNGPNKINLQEKYAPEERANTSFLQYIVNLKAERSFARDDGDMVEAERIDSWFRNFENRLKDIFEASSLVLDFDRKNYNFRIIVDENEPFMLSELSDGHAAILSILTELTVRMETKASGGYNMQGIVLIDEIETHLHVDLQRKILPLLNDFFSKSTIHYHDPFTLRSILNRECSYL